MILRVSARIAAGERGITGLMLESFLVAGAQPDRGEPVYGKSVADQCMDFPTTATVLASLFKAGQLAQVLAHSERRFRSLETLVPHWGGEVYRGEFAKGRHQTAVPGAARYNDMTGFDAFQGNGGDVGSQALVKTGRDGDRLPGGDEF